MSTKADTLPASQGEPITASASPVEALPKGTKRKRSRTADVSKSSNVSEGAPGPAPPKPSPNKRRRKDSPLAAADEAIHQSQPEDEIETQKKRKQAEKAALRASKAQEKASKKLLEAAEKKRKREERAALKAIREERKKAEEAEKKIKREQRAQKKTWKKDWEAFVEAHDVHGETVDWAEDEEKEGITQTDAGKVYGLKASELVCLKHHPRFNFKFGNTTKLFDEEEVRRMAWRKVAMLAGVQGGGTAEEEDALIAKGKKMWEDG
ncbi:uncharacterized protein N0V89_001890 [Didymosphaeria variabile]|uniref:Uncharacterized protein n=1 Tax=Didymosphaeria variabile TaxID=1932322 RepID=A0A9W8XTG4_9PLEO|nr:uncharacterized protein N0V89_001890 [Didymosphaeria variabile]KAJ4357315.1 hypothetical protein N0V89_001890 [Didymosphaeria variabile]